MQEIKCPNCQQAFTIDEAGYANILQQVRTDQFNRELSERMALAAQDKQKALELTLAKAATELHQATAAKDNQIQELKAKLQASDMAKTLAITQAVSGVEKERDALKGDLEKVTLEKRLSEQNLKEKYETQIKDRDDAIERLRDKQAKLSTKMVGESLEQHCEVEFNKIRHTAFPKAYFEKDNDARTGSKGDFIFRDHSDEGHEIVSIMFEMKNESDTTATKKRNEDFLAELHKDRTEKGCEYAVLVSMLESDNELYNTGIVDMSHRHEKMYVIRPQFFIPMITVLRNASTKALGFKAELELAKSTT